MSGEEPSNPFVWFTLTCDDAEVDATVAALQALPMVLFAARRPRPFLAELVSYGTNPDAATATVRQIRPAPSSHRMGSAGAAAERDRIAITEGRLRAHRRVAGGDLH